MLCSSGAGRLQEGGLTFLDLRQLMQSGMRGPRTDGTRQLWDQAVGCHHRLVDRSLNKPRWRTGRPGLLQSMGQTVGHDRATELTELMAHLTGYVASLLYLGVFPEDSRNCPLVYPGANRRFCPRAPRPAPGASPSGPAGSGNPRPRDEVKKPREGNENGSLRNKGARECAPGKLGLRL